MEFIDKADILGELWLNYKSDKEFSDFIEYNDLGLPLAYFISDGLVGELSDQAVKYVEETFDIFLAGLGIKEQDLQPGTDLITLLEIVSKPKK